MMLEKLSNAFGPSGCEGDVRRIVISDIKSRVDELTVDHLGNVICRMKATGRGKKPLRIMAAAHLDEVGMIITHADDDGFLHFDKIGGIDDRILPAKGVVIGAGKVPGVIIAKPVHLTSAEERGKVISHDDLVIDIGAANKDAAVKKCAPGDYATFDTRFRRFGRGLVAGKAFDDRVGCAVLIELIKRGPYPFEFCPVFTTMEEVGLRGAKVAAFKVRPDIALVLESTICEDSPKEKDRGSVTAIGKGPALSLADRGLIVNRKLVRFAARRAAALGVPCQFKQPGIGGTDGGAIHKEGEGAPTLPVSVPARYIHSPMAVISLRDFHHTIDLAEDVMRHVTLADIQP
ncbi:MAG: M42 family peptidase [Lentisphaeria bacterium]|nr:M42 family peptidase [Lentisphaeria bacterium]